MAELSQKEIDALRVDIHHDTHHTEPELLRGAIKHLENELRAAKEPLKVMESKS